MKTALRRVPFYFLRHGETDHNLHRIYDDVTEIHLNENGREQAFNAKKIFNSIPIMTVCSSPLLRVQQTKNIIFENKLVHHVILEEFRECPGSLWRLFLEAESRELTNAEWVLIDQFVSRVRHGLEKALECDAPVLLVAHGGIYWALAHLLNLQGIKKIGNCVLMRIFPESQNEWKSVHIGIE